ncbi:MAG: DUF4367 domain-containing protein [Ruminococcaceae bacterium]|nr:DUF4367 domain-containing protein [Oscillospiraceae bacterium]
MKCKRIIGFICVFITVASVMVSCESSEAKDDRIEQVEKILDQLREVDSSAALYSTTDYYKLVYSNDAGDEINFYNVKTEYYGEIREIEGVHVDAIRSVIDPIIAEDSRELRINDKEAIIYTYKGREYLCWTLSPEDSCVIEYEPGVFPDEEIIKMAESVEPTKED